MNLFHGSHGWRILYGTCINIVSLVTCLFGASLFLAATFAIFLLVMFIYATVFISFFVRSPHAVLIPAWNAYAYEQQTAIFNRTDPIYGHYTGLSAVTMRENTHANYTVDYTTGAKMNFAEIFGILFSSTAGLLAAANMSGRWS